MARVPAIATVLLGVVFPSGAWSSPSTKETDVDGICLQYVNQGSGEPIVFVHEFCCDLRV